MADGVYSPKANVDQEPLKFPSFHYHTLAKHETKGIKSVKLFFSLAFAFHKSALGARGGNCSNHHSNFGRKLPGPWVRQTAALPASVEGSELQLLHPSTLFASPSRRLQTTSRRAEQQHRTPCSRDYRIVTSGEHQIRTHANIGGGLKVKSVKSF